MPYYFCKFFPPRPDFLATMSPTEAKLLKEHGDYLQALLEDGKVIAHGPVIDPEGGGFGLSLFDVMDQGELDRLTAQDPMILAAVGGRYEALRMLQLRHRG